MTVSDMKRELKTMAAELQKELNKGRFEYDICEGAYDEPETVYWQFENKFLGVVGSTVFDKEDVQRIIEFGAKHELEWYCASTKIRIDGELKNFNHPTVFFDVTKIGEVDSDEEKKH